MTNRRPCTFCKRKLLHYITQIELCQEDPIPKEDRRYILLLKFTQMIKQELKLWQINWNSLYQPISTKLFWKR